MRTAFDACIERLQKEPEIAKHIAALDKYDFSSFLTDGRSLYNIQDAIEAEYDDRFYQENGFYMFDAINGEEFTYYLQSRYNIRFQPYIDWVVRCDIKPVTKTNKGIIS